MESRLRVPLPLLPVLIEKENGGRPVRVPPDSADCHAWHLTGHDTPQ
jgi:hypothetical protein